MDDRPAETAGSAQNDLPIVKNRLVDVVLVVDISQSMRPCLEGLLGHLDGLIEEISRGQGKTSRGELAGLDWRIGVVAHHGSR